MNHHCCNFVSMKSLIAMSFLPLQTQSAAPLRYPRNHHSSFYQNHSHNFSLYETLVVGYHSLFQNPSRVISLFLNVSISWLLECG
ncbi:hypothetical protein HYC85_000171 [Camellia sinensis]|uniref:Uncharacterized protein n=1 Tax=Camellia sinensis TaxID=4442 RepID=A0A7J7I1M9_CAMSI|nr:hypothetical protein HYC85_000171 [Camellia sinensis]